MTRVAQTFAMHDCLQTRQLLLPALSPHHTEVQGVETGWTGVDMSTPLLPQVVPGIDANPVSFYLGGGG